MTFFWLLFSVSLIFFLIFVVRAKPIYTFALAILLFTVNFFPFLWGVGISFFDFFPPTMKFVGFKNLIGSFSDPGLVLSAKITALWAMTSMAMEILISYSIALSLYSIKKFSGLLYAIVLIPWAVPSYISVISWTSLIEGYGGDSFLSRILHVTFNLSTNVPAAFLWSAFVAAWLGIPLMTIVILSSLQTLPPHLRDLAEMEGANSFEKAINVYIPQTLPIVFPYIFIIFLESFKEFSTIFLMTAGGPAIVSGFGSKSIVGATTVLGMLMYDKFSITQNYGVLGAYSVAIGVIMLLLVAVGWNYRSSKKNRNLILAIIITHIIFDFWGIGSGFFGILPVLFYLIAFFMYEKRSKRFKKFVLIGSSFDLAYLIFSVAHSGLSGVSISAVISFIVALTIIFEGRIYISILKIPDLLWKVLKMSWLVLWAIIVFLPIWNVFVMGVSKENILPISNLLPRGLTLNNFSELFSNYNFGQAILNSVVIGIMAIAIVLVTVFPATYAAANSKRASRIGFLLLISSFFTGMHTMIPLAITFRFLGLLDTLLGVSIVIALHGSVISYFLLYPFLSGLPKNLDEAAKIDGANGFTRMVRIALPLSLPALWTIIVFVFIDSWSSFVIPLIFLNSENLYPVSMTMYNLVGQYGLTYSKWNLFGAGSVINIVVILIVFLIARKSIMSGIISKNGVDD